MLIMGYHAGKGFSVAIKRDVVLLSYFLGLNDRKISERLNEVRQTVGMAIPP